MGQGWFCPPRVYLARFADFSGCHNLRWGLVLLAASRSTARLGILQPQISAEPADEEEPGPHQSQAQANALGHTILRKPSSATASSRLPVDRRLSLPLQSASFPRGWHQAGTAPLQLLALAEQPVQAPPQLSSDLVPPCRAHSHPPLSPVAPADSPPTSVCSAHSPSHPRFWNVPRFVDVFLKVQACRTMTAHVCPISRCSKDDIPDSSQVKSRILCSFVF